MMKRTKEDSGKFITKVEQMDHDFMYWSKLLKKPFESKEELIKAEETFKAEEAAKNQKLEVKKTRAEEVQNAYKEVIESRKKAQDIINKARDEATKLIAEKEDKYIKLRDAFAKDYNGYHMTYTNNNGEEKIEFSDVIKTFNDLFDFKFPFTW